MIAMQTQRDCGPVAISNLLEAKLGMDAAEVYRIIREKHGFPATENLLDDLWDSPARHARIIRSICGENIGEDFGAERCSVSLVYLGAGWFHYLVLLNSTSTVAVWHTGKDIVSTSSPLIVPVGLEVCRYRIGAPSRLPWWWRAWLIFTDLALFFAR